MTREELRDYVDEQRGLDNIPYHVYSTLIDGIDTLEQEPFINKPCVSEKQCEHDKNVILDKIRAEIVELQKDYREYGWAYVDALNIIDKYKVESEDD